MSKKVLFAVLSIVSLVSDQVTKWWANANLRGHAPKVVIADYFQFEYARNKGVAFSLMSGDEPWRRPFLIAVGLFALGFVLYLVARAAETQRRLVAGLALIAGGAIGNIVDRAISGSVVDFIVLHYKQHRWPTFNIADAALVIGVGLLLLDITGKTGEPLPAPAKSKR